ncbi:MAG: hypothetical protein IJM68_00915 [Synergistaceae bacterium]|nr:hypothetical protein [Synergistaceae bacterium]
MLKSMLHIAIFLNCWVVGRCLITFVEKLTNNDTDFEAFLRLIFSVAGFNVLVLASALLRIA